MRPITNVQSVRTAGILPISRVRTDEAGTIKFAQRTADGLEIESVVIPMRGRGVAWKTLCLSTQVGCARGCTFCQTARMGLVRNLTVEEIVGQVVAARDRLGASIRNVVFMGMGEPLDNLHSVISAVERLHSDRAHQIPRRRITISTAGRCHGIRRLARLKWRRLNLAVSLNAPNDRIRSAIMPINRIEPMARLHEAIAAYPIRGGGHVLIEYVLLKGVNDRPEHARELAAYLEGLRTCVNLIPWNPSAGLPYETPDEATIEDFKRILVAAGQLTFRRITRGRPAWGACGQLGTPGVAGAVSATVAGSKL
ncbi:MAG: 23S rRNA (adenine(2503)-C(2))-methyltransferase RlmN [Phycisphaerae bacterium]